MRDGGGAGLALLYPKLTVGTLLLPLSALLFCLIWSLLMDFEATTGTHCEVDEFAPSISAVIGSKIPQKYVWNICIAIHSAPRFLFSTLYAHFLQERLTLGSYTGKLVKVNFFLNFAENFSLLGLSFVPSSEWFEVHAFFFFTFLLTSILSMTITRFYLFTHCGFQVRRREERNSLHYKKRLVQTTYVSVFLAGYFYWRHNEYCEPYVYSFFGVFEYIVVLCNMAYHVLGYLDFSDWVLRLSPEYILVR